MGYVIYYKSTGGGVAYHTTLDAANDDLALIKATDKHPDDLKLTTWTDYEYVVMGYTEEELALKRFVETAT